MLITKNNPEGIDIPIQNFQKMLHDQLLIAWDIDTADYRCYGRCYRNKRNEKYIAENYEGNKEYKEVYWDDSYKAVSFFGISSNEKQISGDIVETVNVHLVFFVNIQKLRPDIQHRGDEEIRKAVQMIAKNAFYDFEYASTDLWLENCLREYNGSAKTLESKIDMHPVHCFRINFELKYSKNDCG